ncbi:hypothetical protein QWZ10_24250 [Paracoccus cavernae]|uniref:Uncharacterized protein n=1 Tax=Paracoccus cavernae TaxID=1571207 RepID=A0ABT8DEJ7_9RHOB|nr:hypothetical protein [Paracoccus cavernae]
MSMSHRLRAVFHRYATTHAKTSSGPHRIGEEGQPIGFVDRAEFAQGRVRIQGWAHAKEITLTLPGLKITTQPQLLREDVQRATGLPAACGFELVLPASWQGLCDNPSRACRCCAKPESGLRWMFPAWPRGASTCA